VSDARANPPPGRPFACVLGDTDLLRALRLARVPCAVAEPPDEPAHYSRLARYSLAWADPKEQPDLLLRSLEQFAASTAAQPVLFYDEDRYVILISRERDRLARHFRFVVPSRELVEDVVDKSRFVAWDDPLPLLRAFVHRRWLHLRPRPSPRRVVKQTARIGV